MSRASVLRSVLHKSHTEHSWYVLFLSLSLSLSLSVSPTDEDAFFLGFLAGEIVQSLTRARTRRRSVRVIFGFALRAFATFFSLSSIALKFEDFIYTARASSALA